MTQPQQEVQPQQVQGQVQGQGQGQGQQTHEAKAAFTASLRSIGANYETELRDRARTLHANAAAVEKQEAELRRTTAALARQNEGWAKVADFAREGLKEIGDVQNWAEIIERDLLVLEETVRLVEEGERGIRGEGIEGETGETAGDGDGDGDGDLNGGKAKGKEKERGWFGWW